MEPSSTVTLNRLLLRLESTLLTSENAESASRLRGSQYERTKVGSNIEYARTLLLTLEKQSSTIRVQTQRQQAQADLQQKRELVKRLNARLEELNQLGDEEVDDSSEEEDGSDGEVVLPSFAPARSDAQDGIDTGEAPSLRIPDPPPEQPNDLRSRRPLQTGDNRSAASTTAREQLFSGRPQESSTLPQTETLLSHNRSEQENLTTSLLSLAQALKQSSLQFGSSMESEKEVLTRASGGLDKSSQGMEAAWKKMGMLRKMSEGQGWWGRMKLYAMIFGLWIAAFTIVFIGPKLRF